MSEITELLGRMQAGDAGARDSLFAIAYPELRRLAQSRLRRGRRATLLDTTSLVHESYLRFLSVEALRAEDRRAFFAYAAEIMRSVIVTAARERLADKRGGGQDKLVLSTEICAGVGQGEDAILRVHEAIEVLLQADTRLGHVALMRYFGGYTETEIADTLGVTMRTVQRDWEKARIILAAALQ